MPVWRATTTVETLPWTTLRSCCKTWLSTPFAHRSPGSVERHRLVPIRLPSTLAPTPSAGTNWTNWRRTHHRGPGSVERDPSSVVAWAPCGVSPALLATPWFELERTLGRTGGAPTTVGRSGCRPTTVGRSIQLFWWSYWAGPTTAKAAHNAVKIYWARERAIAVTTRVLIASAR